MEDLVQWLRAQLDEEAEEARAVAAEFGAVWTANEQMEGVQSDVGADVVDEPNSPYVYIARHDPARVLREIDAKRRILAEHALNGWVCATCDNGEVEQVFPCPTLRILALPYADRPGYREDWRP